MNALSSWKDVDFLLIGMDVWIYTFWILGYFELRTYQEESRGLLFMTNGSSFDFDQLWGYSSYNDPDRNKSDTPKLLDPATVGGDFKCAIDPAWGEASEINIYLYNAQGDVIAEFDFDVLDVNLTSLSDWFSVEKHLFSWPYVDTGWTTTTPVLRNGTRELLMTTDGSQMAYFAIGHGNQWPTAMLLAVNSTELIDTTMAGNLENLIEPTSVELLNIEHPGWTDVAFVTNSSVWGWQDNFMFMTGVSVYATNSKGDHVVYNVTYVLLDSTLYWNYYGDHLISDGSTVSLPSSIVTHLEIRFSQTAKNITVSVLGPGVGSFVVASMMYVQGVFDNSTVSTSSTTSTTSTTSTSSTMSSTTLTSTSTSVSTTSPSSTSAVTSAATTSPTTSTPTTNTSILVNGTLYCPCVRPNVTNSTLNNLTLEQIVDAIVRNLTVNKDTLSSNVRRYTSAEDNRPSAKTFGAFAVVFIAMTFSFVVYIDGATLVHALTKIPKNYKRLKKRLSKRSLRVDDISTQVVENNVIYAENVDASPPRPGITRSMTMPNVSM